MRMFTTNYAYKHHQLCVFLLLFMRGHFSVSTDICGKDKKNEKI
jgi:hypothetical protein